MRRFLSICLTLAVLTAGLMTGADLWAKGGRGGFKGGGGPKASANFRGKGSKSAAGSIDRGKLKQTFERSLNRKATTGYSRGGDQPWSKHQARELQKYDHRKQVADHLREISDRNGNEQLKQVADDMDLRAQTHYDKQMDKINQKYGLDDTFADNRLGAEGNALDDPGEVLSGNDKALDEVARKLTGRENALYRQMQNEQRKLAKRMEAVDRMRQMAQQSGDDGMLQEADRLDEWATNHFDQRMAQITNFQQRHDLSGVGQYLSP
jgi:hypothetical protein